MTNEAATPKEPSVRSTSGAQPKIITRPPAPRIRSITQNWPVSRSLFHQTIRIGLSQTSDGKYQFLLQLEPLSDDEKRICHTIHQNLIAEYRSLGKTKNTKLPKRTDIISIIEAEYPLIPSERRRIIASSLFFHHDPGRWVRLLITEPEVTGILCPGPEAPVSIRWKGYRDSIPTNIILKRCHVDNLARFFLKSAGVDPQQQTVPDRIKFNGILISLTRQGDSSGWSWRIAITKSRSSDSHTEYKGLKELQIPDGEGSDNGHVHTASANKAPFSGTPHEDQKVEDLVNRIFEQSIPSKITELKTEETDPLTPGTPEGSGFGWKLINPLKKSLSSFTSLTKVRKKEEDVKVESDSDTVKPPSVLNLQNQEDGTVAEEAYWLFQPHSYVAVIQDQNKDRLYRVVEPELSPRERIILEETHDTLRDVLVYDKPVMKGELFLEYAEVEKIVRTYDPKITEDRLGVLYYYLKRNLNGYGKIDPLMYDELLEDISCNGHNLPVYVHHRYYGSIPTSIRFESDELNKFVLKLSQKADKQVSLTSPLLDASLPNGARAQITYSDVVSTKGSSFTIRKFRSDPMTPATLMSFGTYSDELLAFIWLALENRQSMIVVGGTASGKTSAMNAFSFFIPHNSKIVSLEDTREIQIPQKNWLPVQTRSTNVAHDRGNVDLFDLLKASLRQRPEYIIVGEVRGSEAQTLFQAMNSGHTTISTLHAGNIEEALNRLTNEPINVPAAMFGALNLMVIQTFHYREGRMIRRCDAIHEIVLGDGDKVKWNTLFEYAPETDTFRRVYKRSKTLQTIQYMHNWSDTEIRFQLDVRAAFLKRLKNKYSTDPEQLMRMITDLRRSA